MFYRISIFFKLIFNILLYTFYSIKVKIKNFEFKIFLTSFNIFSLYFVGMTTIWFEKYKDPSTITIMDKLKWIGQLIPFKH